MKKVITFLMTIVIINLSCVTANATSDEIPLPGAIQVYCWEVGNQFNVSAPLLMSIVYQESRGNPKAKNGKCIGCCQINPRYFKEYMKELNITDLKNPYQNILLCGKQLSVWFEKYGDIDVYLIIEMWNEGEENALKDHNEKRPSYYSRKIVDREAEFSELWDKSMERIRP